MYENSGPPRITIVTTTLNAEAYLDRCIQSIANQRYPNLEHIIIDAGSSDRTHDIVQQHSHYIHKFEVVDGIGLYAGLRYGLEQSSGEIMGWLNADDMLLPGALHTVAGIFTKYSHVNWITGRPSAIDYLDRIFAVEKHKYWSRRRFILGAFRWIQQESTFWRRRLWDRTGGLNPHLRFAGDFDLWLRYFEADRLYLADCLIGAFRLHSTQQISQRFIHEYHAEVAAAYRLLWQRKTIPQRVILRAVGLIELAIRPFWRRNPHACDRFLQMIGLDQTIRFAPRIKLDPSDLRFHVGQKKD